MGYVPHWARQKKWCLYDSVSIKKARFRFALMLTEDANFSIMKECRNYDGSVPGHIRKPWTTVLERLTAAEAHKAYNNRLGREVVTLMSLQYHASEFRLQQRSRAQADDEGMAFR